MGKIAVPEIKGFLLPIKTGRAGEIDAHLVPALILRQHFIYIDSYKLSGPVAEPEPHRSNFPVCVGTGNHLYRYVNAQNAFQGKSPFLNEMQKVSDSIIITCRTYVFDMEILSFFM